MLSTHLRTATATGSARSSKETIMHSKYFENGLALVAALIILVGVMVAANTALAGDMGTVEIHSSAQK
jgi:hypothetical protein